MVLSGLFDQIKGVCNVMLFRRYGFRDNKNDNQHGLMGPC
jgi:hypothetical protein